MNESKELTFEQALVELEGVVRELEDGETGLEKSLASYEKGIALLKHCYGQLNQAEQKIRLLTGVDEAGEPMTKPFDHSASAKKGAISPESKAKKSANNLFQDDE